MPFNFGAFFDCFSFAWRLRRGCLTLERCWARKCWIFAIVYWLQHHANKTSSRTQSINLERGFLSHYLRWNHLEVFSERNARIFNRKVFPIVKLFNSSDYFYFAIYIIDLPHTRSASAFKERVNVVMLDYRLEIKWKQFRLVSFCHWEPATTSRSNVSWLPQ